MMKKILCLVSALAIVLSAPVLAERYYAAGNLNRAVNEDLRSNWREGWEEALSLEDMAEQSLSRGEDAEAASFADFVWDAGWFGFSADVEID